MNINLENYEIWFLDYAEGNLDESQVETLFSFLENHPDLKSELEEFSLMKLNETEDTFPNKLALKKTTEYRTDDFIAYHEGDLSNDIMKAIEDFITTNQDSKKEFDELGKMYIAPDLDLTFEDKSALKKSNKMYSTDDYIAYHEGALSSESMKAIDDFIATNQDSKKEFDELGKVYLAPALDITFKDKSALKKSNKMYSTDDYIAYHEGDLNEVDQKLLIAFLEKNNSEKKEFEKLGSVYLFADGNIVYPNKGSLKKREGKIIVMNWRVIAIAASILLMMALFFLQDNQSLNSEIDLAENNNQNHEAIDTSDTTNKAITDPIIDPLKTYKNQVAIEDQNISIHKNNEEFNNQVAKDTPNNVGSNNEINKGPNKVMPINFENENNVAQKRNDIKKEEPITNEGVNKIMEIVKINAIDYKAIALENILPNKLNNVVNIPKNNQVEKNDVAQVNSSEDASKESTLLAFAEKKAARVITDNKSNKLRLFDVIKKVGEKSRLYDLKEDGDEKYSLKVANVEIGGKRKNISL